MGKWQGTRWGTLLLGADERVLLGLLETTAIF